MGADHEHYSSAVDVSNSMPCELSWSPPARWSKDSTWVFWSQYNNELDKLLASSYISVHFTGNQTITRKIKAFMPYIYPSSIHLIQFWAPVRTGDGIYLTMADQPFGLTKSQKGFHKGLCLYRKRSVLSMLIPVDADEVGDEKEQNLHPVARVFKHGLHEYCRDVSYCLNEEYPQRDDAIESGVKSYWALPMFETVGKECIGVLEIVSTLEIDMLDTLGRTYNFTDQLKEVGLICEVPWPFSPIFKNPAGFSGAHQVMEDICRSYQLPFAQLWNANSTSRCIYRNTGYQSSSHDLSGFDSSFGLCSLWEGKGVVGKAFASRSACFCSNVSKLSINVYPWVANARKLGLAGCFAVCLQSTVVDHFYILEFFLSPSRTNYGGPRSFLKSLVGSLKRRIKQSMGAHVQELREKLFVEVIKNSSADDELDSFEICDDRQIINRRKRNGFITCSEVQSNSPSSPREMSLEMHLGLGPWNGIRSGSYSMVQPNYPSSLQAVSLDMHLGLGPFSGHRNCFVVRPDSPSSVQELSLDMHLGLVPPRKEVEDDSTSSFSVHNYPADARRFSVPSTSQCRSNSDSDFSDINAMNQIFRRAKRRKGIQMPDLLNATFSLS